MHKSKKKTAKLPKPIKVKKEKTDEERLPQPMSHYIDDRLELVKQVFGSLKPKTIINLAPEFLKSQGLEEIEEACLNELLCISTKRLKSIITASKCPSDTESSEDDDVQRHEEHVSLEEISSDSEIEGGVSKKGKKKKAPKTGDKNKSSSKTEPPKSTEGNPEDGQISVLELLELQARARAIRSQLALEPVTKIEVDSDGDGQAEKTSKKDKKSNKSDANKNERKRSSSVRESLDSSNALSKSSDKDTDTRKTKKVKLKRNYRNSSVQNREEEENRKDDESIEKQDRNGKEDGGSEKYRSQEKESNEKSQQDNRAEKIKREKSSRSPSPDVIPIIAEPETLMINDSSDEDERDKNVEKETLSSSNPQGAENIERDRKKSETEEGELNDGDGADKIDENVKPPNNSQDLEKGEKESNTDKQTRRSSNEKSKAAEPLPVAIDASKDDATVKPATSTTTTTPDEEEDDDEDQNDDVISLGEDLEDEMDEQLESEANAQKSSFVENKSSGKDSPEPSKKSKKKKYDEKEHSEDNQSWHSRYMKSSKVSKVLAASRLGKRVRDKIKKSKEAPRESSEKAEPKEDVFKSKHEDGSLDQYKELLELRQRKSK